MLGTGNIPTPNPELLQEEFDGEIVILDLETGDLHHLDRSASLVWAALDGVRDLEEVVRALTRVVSADRDRLVADVDTAISQFAAAGLVTTHRRETPSSTVEPPSARRGS